MANCFYPALGKDGAGHIVAVHAEYLPETRSGSPDQSSVKTKTAIHWLPLHASVPAEVLPHAESDAHAGASPSDPQRAHR
jgi:hypothetical protein